MIFEKGNFEKYVILSDQDKKWGFNIVNAGFAQILPDSAYPNRKHPNDYMFSWDTGRKLKDFHLVMITKGKGKFESDHIEEVEIKAGDAFFLFPDEWHRYKPAKHTGWTEFWVGMSGSNVLSFINSPFFNKNTPIITQFNGPRTLILFESILKLVHEEPFGFQRTASGYCIQLSAHACNLQLDNGLKTDQNTVSRAKLIMHEKINQALDLEELAVSMGVGYSKFRIDFKNQTGFAPLQYFILLKMAKAKSLLLNTSLSIKEIAYELGFESDLYFRRLFKKKEGVTPNIFRKENR